MEGVKAEKKKTSSLWKKDFHFMYLFLHGSVLWFPLGIYCLGLTIGNVWLYYCCFCCLLPCFAEQLTALLQSLRKACVRPYRPLTIWKQWASEKDDSCWQQSSYHPRCKSDIAERGMYHNMDAIIKNWERLKYETETATTHTGAKLHMYARNADR